MKLFHKSNPLYKTLHNASQATAKPRAAIAKYGAPTVAGLGSFIGGPLGSILGTAAGAELTAIGPGSKKEKLKNTKTTVAVGAATGLLSGLFGSLTTSGALGSIFGAGRATENPTTGEPIAAGDAVAPGEGGPGIPSSTLRQPSLLQSVFGNHGGGAANLIEGLTGNATDGTAAGPDANAAAAAAASRSKVLIGAGLAAVVLVAAVVFFR